MFHLFMMVVAKELLDQYLELNPVSSQKSKPVHPIKKLLINFIELLQLCVLMLVYLFAPYILVIYFGIPLFLHWWNRELEEYKDFHNLD